MSSGNEHLVRRYYESTNARDFAASRECLADGAVLVVMGTGERIEGGDAIIGYDQGWLTAFPDARLEVDAVAVAGDIVVIEYTGSGTHTGPLETPGGPVEATGRAGMLSFCDVVTVRGGFIVEVREYFDTLSLLAQLGLVPDTLATA